MMDYNETETIIELFRRRILQMQLRLTEAIEKKVSEEKIRLNYEMMSDLIKVANQYGKFAWDSFEAKSQLAKIQKENLFLANEIMRLTQENAALKMLVIASEDHQKELVK